MLQSLYNKFRMGGIVLQKYKYRLQGILIGIVLSCTFMFSVTGYAAGISKTIKAVFNAVTVKIDGKVLAGDKINYNGGIYVNIKNVADLLGKNYQYDSKSAIVNLTTKVAQAPAQQAPQIPATPSLSSRKNPAGINDVISIHTETIDKKTFDSTIVLESIIRGSDAWNMISAANMFNSKPEDGYEIILAKFSFKVNKSSNEDVQFDLNPYDFKLVSSDGKDYDFYSCVLPSPTLQAKLYQGASNEGWVAFKVKVNDLRPLIVYSKSYDGTGGVWFKGYTDTPASNSPPAVTNNTNQPPTAAISQQPSTDTKITTINSASDLKAYLEQNYSSLDTSIGETSFKFSVMENKDVVFPFDYWIMMDYDTTFFYKIQYSIQYTDEQKTKVKQELKDFQEKLARDIIAKLPNKKIQGGYFHSYYKYPNLKMDLVVFKYYSWTNYDQTNLSTDIKKIYESTKPSMFRWDTLTDNQL